MTEIIPAILESSWEEVEKKINLVSSLASWIQLDITDGAFVPEKTWDNPYNLKRYLEVQSLNIEVDLMVSNPENVMRDWVETGIKRLIVHIESTDRLDGIVKFAKMRAIQIGIALNIDTPNEVLRPWIDKVDFVQFMGIAKIGYQGQKFDSRVYTR